VKKNHNFIVSGLVAHNMQIFIKTLNGQVRVLDVEPSTSIEDVKEQLMDKLGVKIENQPLIFAGK
jgi:hypothetical protein